jgi:hypothetical protein
LLFYRLRHKGQEIESRKLTRLIYSTKTITIFGLDQHFTSLEQTTLI